MHKNKKKIIKTYVRICCLPLCSVNIFELMSRASFGTLDLIRLARNDVPAPRALPGGRSFTCCAPISVVNNTVAD